MFAKAKKRFFQSLSSHRNGLLRFLATLDVEIEPRWLTDWFALLLCRLLADENTCIIIIIIIVIKDAEFFARYLATHIVKQGAVLFVRSVVSPHAFCDVLTYLFSSERFFSFMMMDKNYARSVIQIYAISRSSDGWLTLTEVLVTQEYWRA